MENWIDGKKMGFDVSVVSRVQDAVVYRAAETPASAIEMRKSSKIREHCRALAAKARSRVPSRPGDFQKLN